MLFRILRLAEAYSSGCRCRSLPVFLSWICGYCYLRVDFLPSRYHQKKNDDDVRTSCQIQGIHRLHGSNLEERRCHVHDEGSWSQHSERCCRCWCTGRIRCIQGSLHWNEEEAIGY